VGHDVDGLDDLVDALRGGCGITELGRVIEDANRSLRRHQVRARFVPFTRLVGSAVRHQLEEGVEKKGPVE
jgi:hypothetical protein